MADTGDIGNVDYEEVQHRIAVNLKRLRKSRKWSQEKLSALSDVDRSYIGYIENCRNNVSVKILCELSMALECDISEFFASMDVRTRDND